MAAAAVAMTLDSTFVRSCEDGERHLEVRVGNVETETGGRQAFGAVAKTDTDVKVPICQSLDAVGRTKDTVLTAFTDGCAGLRRILADAGITGRLPVLRAGSTSAIYCGSNTSSKQPAACRPMMRRGLRRRR